MTKKENTNQPKGSPRRFGFTEVQYETHEAVRDVVDGVSDIPAHFEWPVNADGTRGTGVACRCGISRDHNA